jgi:hypothetical protein
MYCGNAISARLLQNQINAPGWGKPIGEDLNVSSVNTSSWSNEKENWDVFGVVCVRTFKAQLKLKEAFKHFLRPGTTCPD